MPLKTAGEYLAGLFGFGKARASNAYPASKTDDQYPARPELALDQKDLLRRLKHRELLNSTRHLYNAFPGISGAVNDIANHAIGEMWQPQYRGKDEAFGERAESWLHEWSKIVDVRGFPYSLPVDMHVAITTLIRDGEFFIYKTENASGYPLIQFLEAHRVGERYGVDGGRIIEGPYAGLTQRNGIAYNTFSRPVAYHFLGDTPASDQWIDAQFLQHVFDPKWFSQGRGISPLVYGVLDWLDVMGWRNNEKMAQVIFSSISYTEHNEEGGPSGLQARMAKLNAGTNDNNQAKPNVENFVKGAVRYFKLNGSDIKAFENKRPSPNQANFEERVLRGAFKAIGWTYEQAYNSKGQGGANVRRDVAQNQRSVEHYQGTVRMAWERIIVYGIARAASIGAFVDSTGEEIILTADWYKWRPQLPRRMTVDNGRDSKANIEELRTGVKTMIDDIRERGGDERQHLQDQVRWYNLKLEFSEKNNIPEEKWPEVFGSLLHNPTTSQPDNDEPPARNREDDEEEEEEKTEDE
jgi:capsid protein